MDKQGLKSRSMTVVDGLTVKVMPNERLVDILSDVAKIDDKAIRLSLVEKLTNFNN